MKKIILGLIFIFSCNFLFAQNGLENILVEKYYVSNANDTSVNADGGVLPVGSVTYRIYVDMLPGYRFQAVYGVPDHEMRIETSTLFFNNEDRGATTPTYSKSQAANNTVMLDSWLSVGGACSGQIGVLKSADNGVATVVNADGVLQNNDTSAGIPISVEDGMIAGTPEAVTTIGLTSAITVFDNQNDGTNGPLFSTFNGSWAALSGSVGPDSLTNQVLIAQITTNGIFSFELNIQIGTPSGGVEQYVAKNPVGSEILFPALNYTSPLTRVNEPTTEPVSVFLYPNPVHDVLNIQFAGNGKVSQNVCSIYDDLGKIYFSKEFGLVSDNCFESIDISNLASGNYFMEWVSGEKSITRHFIKN